MWHDLLRALALLLVFEGLMPFLSPRGWRDMVLRASTLGDRPLRLVGAALIVCGLVALRLLQS